MKAGIKSLTKNRSSKTRSSKLSLVHQPKNATYKPRLELLESRIVPGFLAASSYPATVPDGHANSLVMQDFNHDGILDLATADYGNNTVSILLGKGDGSFAPPITYPVGNAPQGLATGDFNGDGIPDLAVTNNGSSDVSILLGNGDGTFKPAVNYSGPNTPVAVVVGDFNGDGHLDLAISNNGGNAPVTILLGNGDGTFQSPISQQFGFGSISLTAGDFNHDGKLDLAILNGGSNTVQVLLGNGDGTFAGPQTISLPNDAIPAAIASADLNGDGNQDLIIADGVGNAAEVLLGNGDGSFQPARIYATGNNPRALAIADVNLDGKPDIVLANQSNNDVSILLGNGDGSFLPAQDYVVGSMPDSVVVGDFNGDGMPDIAIANFDTTNTVNDVSILLGNGTGTFPAAVDINSGPTAPFAVVEKDLNGDSRADLILSDRSGDNVDVLIANGDGTFKTPVVYQTGPSPWFYIVGEINWNLSVADFNGDGIPDILVVNRLDNSLNLLIGNGDGTFQPDRSIPIVNHLDFIAVGDVNNDGKMDIVGTDFDANQLLVYLGNGDGTFQPPIASPLSGGPLSFALGDFNRDGKLDVVVASQGSPPQILLGNGDGTFRAGVTFTGHQATFVTITDLNADGKVDLIFTDPYDPGPPLSVFLGNGDGTFQPAINLSPGVSPTYAAVGDFNRDGIPDLAVVNLDGSDVGILLGNGDGTFQQPTFYLSGSAPYSLAIGDINGDGSDDVVVSDYGLSAAQTAGGKGLTIFLNTAAPLTLTPNSVPEGSADLTLTLNGGPFSTRDLVAWDGMPLATTFVNPSELQAVLPATDIADEGTGTITVGSPGANAIVRFSILDNDALTGTGYQIAPTEGQAFNAIVATFTDVTYPSNSPNDFEATIEWGDGSNSFGTITAGNNGLFAVRGSHTYSEQGDFSITVVIRDPGPSVAAATIDSTASVAAGSPSPPDDIVGRVSDSGPWWVAASNGSNGFNSSFFGAWDPSITWVDVVTGDFIGDGRTDIAGRDFNTGNWWVGVSNGSSFKNSLWTTWNPNVTWVDVQVGDFTGDGKADIVGRVLETGQWWVARSTGSSFTNSLWTTWNPMATWVDVKVGDFNGDGKADITGRWLQGGSWWTGISTGTSFSTSMWAQWNPNVTWADVQVGDFNGAVNSTTGDRIMDITGRWRQGGSWWTGISTGTSFSTTMWAQWNPNVTWVDCPRWRFQR
jgi:hypothetical protein